MLDSKDAHDFIAYVPILVEAYFAPQGVTVRRLMFQESPAQRISRARARVGVHMAHGLIRADRVVVTCGGYVGRLQERLSMAKISIATFVMVTDLLGAMLRDATSLDNQVATNYPALARAKVEVAWRGMVPMTRHRFRVIGRLAPNIWFATGLGIALSSAFGRLIAAGLVEGGGQWGRVRAPFVYWWHQMRAGLAAAVP